MVKNFGKTAITSVKFEYGIEGQALSTYTWNTTLAPMASANVKLAELSALNTVTGNNNKFIARIVEVNGAADEDIYNNEMKTTFTASSIWNGGNYVINLKMSASVDGYVNQTNWAITDMAGNIIKQKSGTVSSTLYSDTVHLENGCYKLNVDASYIGYGLRNPYIWASSNAGYFRVVNLLDGVQLNITKNALGTSNYQGNLESYFGNGFDEYFRVTNSTTGIDNPGVTAYSLNIYPNPAKEVIRIDVYGSINTEANIQLVNVLGQTVYSTTSRKQNIFISTQDIANGIYTLIYNTGDSKKTEKVVIAK
jgi:hypothetical protein